MGTALITGSGGLIGSEAVRHFIEAGFDVVGIENDMRLTFFGAEASTAPMTKRLKGEYGSSFRSIDADIRNDVAVDRAFRKFRPDLVIHTAAQPSHDWAATDPKVDFTVNANGTLNLLEATRKYVDYATFIFCSTSKVYGDTPNLLPLSQVGARLDLTSDHEFYEGITPAMRIDRSLHSLFGASKAAADLVVQEYGRYFHMPTVCFRPGCLTGPNHAGTKLHGFLSYLMRCGITGEPYTVFGYDGLQVRCNIHSKDLLAAFACFHRRPTPGAVYNIGGGRRNACSMREAIALVEQLVGPVNHRIVPEPRIGDHRWWISSNADFQRDYPWDQEYDLVDTLTEIRDENAERWAA